MSSLGEIRNILAEVLQLSDQGESLDTDSALLGALPEFDSMAVVSVIAALEEHFNFDVDDDEIDAEVFESVASLVAFVEKKLV